jgi:ankyrin repeat protein
MEFDAAVQAIIHGDAATLRTLLARHPELIAARSQPGGPTLLHYIAANGVPDELQKSPPNAPEIARILLEAGAEPDALAEMYGGEQTTMNMLVSSCHPAEAGVQVALVDVLIDYGASPDTRGSGAPPLITALAFGYPAAAEALVRRGAFTDTLPAAAGLGRLADFQRMLPASSPEERQQALALAAQHGHVEIVRLLLDIGEDPNRLNPRGFHGHSTPLHQAALANHMPVIRLLVERGARLDIQDTMYQGTPLGWAKHGGHKEATEYLQTR